MADIRSKRGNDKFTECGHSYWFDKFSADGRLKFWRCGARDSDWQWQQLGHMQIYTTNHDSTPPLSFLQAGCPSCRPTNNVKALKAQVMVTVN